MVGGQLQALVVPCKLAHLSAKEKKHSVTVMSSRALGQEKTVGSTDVSWWPRADPNFRPNWFKPQAWLQISAV